MILNRENRMAMHYIKIRPSQEPRGTVIFLRVAPHKPRCTGDGRRARRMAGTGRSRHAVDRDALTLNRRARNQRFDHPVRLPALDLAFAATSGPSRLNRAAAQVKLDRVPARRRLTTTAPKARLQPCRQRREREKRGTSVPRFLCPESRTATLKRCPGGSHRLPIQA